MILGVVKGKIKHPFKPGRFMEANFFIDNGSEASYITKECAEELGLPILQRKRAELHTFGGANEKVTFPITQIRVGGKKGQALVEALITEEIITPMRTDKWKGVAKEEFPKYTFQQFEENLKNKKEKLIWLKGKDAPEGFEAVPASSEALN